MAQTPYSLVLLKRLSCFRPNAKPHPALLSLLKPFSTSPAPISSADPKPSSLSARLSFVFDQIDAIEKERSEKDQTLQKIRAWRESKKSQNNPEFGLGAASYTETNADSVNCESPSPESVKLESSVAAVAKKEVEVVHPWPEWIELMERLVQQNYFDHRRVDEDRMVQDIGFEVSEAVLGTADDAQRFDFKDYKTVHTACVNFGKDRFDIIRSLSRQDIQILVGFGCPSTDKKVVFSSKLLRKHTHLDEGDVCSSCSLRSSCERAYLITNKEDEARTIDVMRVLFAYGFDPASVMNKSLMKQQKSVKTVVRKLLHHVVKLSSVPIDPNLPPPIIKKAPPKVKQPPPPPRKRVGRDDIEMKKGDWLCSKCDFMNFAKNTICLQCDAKRPKRQLLPGEWECPGCNFLNYRRNMACFHCDCKRPPDEYLENKVQEKQCGPRTRMEKTAVLHGDTNAWNFDFDDNESDGADVAAFEYADPVVRGEGSLGKHTPGDNVRHTEYSFSKESRVARARDEEFSDADTVRPGRGFDDFDDEDDDIDNYELDTRNTNSPPKASIDFSELEEGSESEDVVGSDTSLHDRRRTKSPSYNKPSTSARQRAAFPVSDDDELDGDSDEELSVHPKWKSSHVADSRSRGRGRNTTGPSKGLSFGSEDELGLYSDEDNDHKFGSRGGKLNKLGSSRRDFQRKGKFDSEDDMVSGSESDNDDFRSHKSSPRRNTESSFKGRGSYSFTEDTQFDSKPIKGGRRNSFDGDFDRSRHRSRSDNRGFRGNDFDGQRMSNRGWGGTKSFNGPRREGFGKGGRGNSYSDDFDRSARGSRDNSRGFRGNDYDGQRTSNRGGDTRNFKGPRREGFGKQQPGNDYNRDRDSGVDNFRNSRRVITR